jgi:hypothetical protein
MATQYTAGLTTGQVLTAATMNSIGAAWETYTPATNCTVGNGTISGHYCQIQKTIHFRVVFTLGSTSVIATDATIEPPFTIKSGSFYVGTAYYRDVSAAQFYIGFTKSQALAYQGIFGYVAGTVPFTWATGDQIYVNATYERS